MAEPTAATPLFDTAIDAIRGRDVIIDRSGRPVDVSGAIWKLDDPTMPDSLDWRDVNIRRREVYSATRAYLRYLIANYSKGEVHGNWYALAKVWASSSFQADCEAGADVSYRAISEVQNALESHE